MIDPPLWRETRNNPIAMLRDVSHTRLERLARDPDFLARYDRVMEWVSSDQQPDRTWFARRHPDLRTRPVAYFCAEFGPHSSVPISSGGLGILAGDHCKTASDLGLPFVGVGLSYMKGYFDQRLRADGWQEDSDECVDPGLTPLMPLRSAKGEPYLAVVDTLGRPVHVQVWTMKVGRIPLYLLGTNLEENHPDDRTLLNKLYAGGPDLRLRQEGLLGVGGVGVLRGVGLDPGVWHANEGHASFMLVERLREPTKPAGRPPGASRWPSSSWPSRICRSPSTPRPGSSISCRPRPWRPPNPTGPWGSDSASRATPSTPRRANDAGQGIGRSFFSNRVIQRPVLMSLK